MGKSGGGCGLRGWFRGHGPGRSSSTPGAQYPRRGSQKGPLTFNPSQANHGPHKFAYMRTKLPEKVRSGANGRHIIHPSRANQMCRKFASKRTKMRRWFACKPTTPARAASGLPPLTPISPLHLRAPQPYRPRASKCETAAEIGRIFVFCGKRPFSVIQLTGKSGAASAQTGWTRAGGPGRRSR
jgi:hypothetical protein